MRRRRSISSHTGGNVVGTLSRYSSSATEEEECERNGNSDETRSRWMSFPCDHFDLLMSRKDVAVTTSVGIAPGSKMEDQQENNKIILQNDSAPSRYSQKELETVKKVQERAAEEVNYYFTKDIVTGYNVSDDMFLADNLCYEYLLSFLEGTTDAKDNCDGIKNAYTAAFCEEANTDNDDDHDDYFVKYNHFSCCKSLKSHFNAYCNKSKVYASRHLLIGAVILLLCEVTKNMIRLQKLHWIPELGGCIIVGLAVGAICHMTPDVQIDNYSFDEVLFLHILLPPILFNAALSIDKRQFCRFRLAIFMMSIVGTMMSIFMTGFMVYVASHNIESVSSLPLLDSLLFGALISSTDPAAILSVLSNLQLSENDAAFILVLGESLLNDSVAISFFNAFVSHYNYEGNDSDEFFDNILKFLYAGLGSIAIGISCGVLAFLYFWLFHKKMNSCMEVACFFLWAGLPYYASEEMGMSGIISIVTIGFIMDMYLVSGETSKGSSLNNIVIINEQVLPCNGVPQTITCQGSNSITASHLQTCSSSMSEESTRQTPDLRQLQHKREKILLSPTAGENVRFVSQLLAQLSENCIFVYLGLFLYSENYEWQIPLILVSIFSCLLSRATMVVLVCNLVWYINKFRRRAGCCYKPKPSSISSALNGHLPHRSNSRTASVLQNTHIQTLLVVSGLRGAVSFSLVESLPIYNLVTNEGTKYKGILKAMASSSILFTLFVMGGSSFYILKHLGIKPFDELARDQNDQQDQRNSGDEPIIFELSSNMERQQYQHL